MARIGDYVEIRMTGTAIDAYGRFRGITDPADVERVGTIRTGAWVQVEIFEALTVLFKVGESMNIPLHAMHRAICESDIPQWRCTRPDMYNSESLGFKNKTARQGHYINAMTMVGAWQQMLKQYPNDKAFDIDPWRKVQWMTIKNGAREKTAIMRDMTLAEVKHLGKGDHVHLVLDGGHIAYPVKVNGMPKTWKTRPMDVSVPYKYGLFKFGYITQNNVLHGQVLMEVTV